MDYEDLLVVKDQGVATIMINRPKKLNAFRPQTVDELTQAIKDTGWDRSVGVIVLTGAGDRAFCVGADQKSHDGKYDGRGTVGLAIEELQSTIRDVPVPIIARINGFAIGGGNVLATICDLSIAAESAQLGQVGPKMGSVDPGFGTALLARSVGDKKAREIWYLCRRYTAQEAADMGLVNKVVPDSELDQEVAQWCAEIVQKSPTALALAKRSFNADTENIRGISSMGMEALALYYDTAESREGVTAFLEKRAPDFRSARDNKK
ncbi:enoyl-CoA hydratase-related protein [Ruegeria sp. EL01]|jgi:2-ketocyclohexanecarboxyl-CoA hydrolase|uniref:enoyl-CoA hydratase-related protein n=1 Tax=Ruegeria sp. EL01 TaxID=2107578 RepID=UPI000EA805B1|nr:enoyl-CoA hydratase-related protein [Ruegeria sp. EL01]